MLASARCWSWWQSTLTLDPLESLFEGLFLFQGILVRLVISSMGGYNAMVLLLAHLNAMAMLMLHARRHWIRLLRLSSYTHAVTVEDLVSHRITDRARRT